MAYLIEDNFETLKCMIAVYIHNADNNKLSKLPDGPAMNWQHNGLAGNKVSYTIDNCFLTMLAIPH